MSPHDPRNHTPTRLLSIPLRLRKPAQRRPTRDDIRCAPGRFACAEGRPVESAIVTEAIGAASAETLPLYARTAPADLVHQAQPTGRSAA